MKILLVTMRMLITALSLSLETIARVVGAIIGVNDGLGRIDAAT